MHPQEQSKVQIIEQLNQTAWGMRVSDSTQSFELSSRALALSNEISYLKGQGEALRTLGFCHIRLAKFQEALPLLDQAFLLFQQVNDLKGQSDVYEYTGIIKRSLGDYAASLDYLFKGSELRQQIGYEDGLSLSFYHIGITYKYLGYLEQALEYLLKSLELGRKLKYWVSISYSLNNIGVIYADMGDNQNALKYYEQSLGLRRESGDKWGEAGCLDNIGLIHYKLGDNTKAEDFCLKSLAITESSGDKKGQGNSLYHLSLIYTQSEESKKAFNYAQQSLKIRTKIGDKKGQAEVLLFLSGLYPLIDQANHDKIEALLKKALKIGKDLKAKDLLSHIHFQYYKFYKNSTKNSDALEHLEIHNTLEKELFNQTFNQKLVNLQITHQVEKSRKEAEIYQLKNIELVQLNEEIQKQRDVLDAQRKNLEETLDNLKKTQTQLIQKEKMASLGELTAGIAHEIQNPLNFVNNFSELSVDLANELKEEMGKVEISEKDKEYIEEILTDLTQNQDKINHHGKRASSIVKGMLEHSRASTGVKELTDINKLADEYFRLSYHGMRAKDKDFNATMETHFQDPLSKIEIIPQDIGRVLLNLFNNAFYAVNLRQQQLCEGLEPSQSLDTYTPSVSVTTQQLDNQIIIKVKDNGMGMPESVRAKVFQPFFTTKPTGQGTGLGLSLAYDIVTKGHGGALEVESTEGVGTTFSIKLPI